MGHKMRNMKFEESLYILDTEKKVKRMQDKIATEI